MRLSADGKRLFVANVKGHGSLQPRKVEPKKDGKGDGDDPAAPQDKGTNSHDHLGSVSLIDVPDAAALTKYTETVNANNRLGYSPRRPGEAAARRQAGAGPGAARRAVGLRARHLRHQGEPHLRPGVRRHEGRQRRPDAVHLRRGGDAEPPQAGPRVHRCSTTSTAPACSRADGHSWANEAYVTDYLEKQFGEFTRSYPYEGSDPLAFPTTGFLWDNALARKKTFRNYGEFVKSTYEPKGATWADLYADYTNGTREGEGHGDAEPALARHVHATRTIPGFPLTTPDVYRAKLFIDELKEFEKKGEFPNLVYLFLPSDHTNGTRPGLADAAGDGGRQRPGAGHGRRGRLARASSGRRRASS